MNQRELQEKFSQLPDEELVGIARGDPDEYREEAIMLAREELRSRGRDLRGPEDLRAGPGIPTQKQSRPQVVLGFTRETLSPRAAKLWIYGAVGVSVFSAIVTALAAINGWLGLGISALVDAVITLGLAYGILRRSVVCTWIALGYYVLSRTIAFFSLGLVPGGRAITFLLIYSAAIVSIKLYPERPQAGERTKAGDFTSKGPGNEQEAV